jgi:hypothetical protein
MLLLNSWPSCKNSLCRKVTAQGRSLNACVCFGLTLWK